MPGIPPIEADRLGWRPAGTTGRWRQRNGTWVVQASGPERALLVFRSAVADRQAYNLRSRSQPPRRLNYVSDVKISCDVDQFKGERLGFVWVARGRQIEATVNGAGMVELTDAAREMEHARSDQRGPNRVTGALAFEEGGPLSISFAVRDGQAYVLDGEKVVARLIIGDGGDPNSELYRPRPGVSVGAPPSAGLLPPEGGSPATVSPAGGTDRPDDGVALSLFAVDCTAKIRRIRLCRDVYYLTIEEAMGAYGMPLRHSGNPIQLGAGEYFVLGDNSPASKDSRFWGVVRADELVGVARFRYWPLERQHWFR
jgi:hypothetical protein